MLPLGIAWLAGVCLAFLALPPPPDLPLFAGLLALGALLAWRMRALLLGVALLSAAVSLVLAEARLQQRMPDGAGRVDRIVTGVIEDFPRVSAGICRFRFRLTDIEDSGPPLRRVQLSWYDCHAPPAAGETWQLKARLRAPRGLQNPGGFDFERWAFRENISATGYVRDEFPPRRLAGCESGPKLLCFRVALVDKLESWLAESPGLKFVIALATGARHRFGNDDWETLRRAGTAHLFAISGLHVGVVAGFAWLLGAGAGRVVQRFFRRFKPGHLAAVTAFLAASSYAALAGFAVSTVRSLAMISAVLILAQLRRHGGFSAALGAALLVVLAPDPFAVLSAGFWLSFGAVALLALGILDARETARRAGETRMGAASAWTRRLALAQWRISLGLVPLLLVFFGEVSLLGAAANLAAIPLFSLLIVPGLLGSLLLALVWPPVGIFLLTQGANLLDGVMSILGKLAGLELAAWTPPEFGLLPMLLAAVGIAWLLAPRPAPLRWAAPMLMLPVALGLERGPHQPELAVTVLDVGQGLAVLVQTPGYNLLYDAGPRYASSDAGGSVVVPAMARLGVRRLHAMVISHGDTDHSGGAASVLAAHPQAELIAPDRYGLSAQHYRRCETGLSWEVDQARFRVLSPDRGAATSGNNASCVLEVETARARILLPGDLESAGERRLLASSFSGPFDLLLSPHHGSASSSSAAFVAETRPRFVVHSNGFFNRWGFPRPSVSSRWAAAGARQWSTGDAGALQFAVRRGGDLELATEWRRGRARLWTFPPPEAEADDLSTGR
ncbi:DNA internalization-related competence protein ComEC/Rec2 [Candidatus Foliamicus sp.]